MRTVIHSMTMVNWRGVFFRTLELHPQVTALEGPNGAGKTTMMIAAYSVLLPEERRLSFTPLGETDQAGERGVWGRLGDGPCYSALDVRFGRGERLLAVIHIERGSQGSQRVELKPLLIRDLPTDTSLQELFLCREAYATGPRDTVRTLAELRSQCRVLGGALTTCKTLKEYYQALFECGLHPLDLEPEVARSKFNLLLKTSMVGGLSRHLDRGLRDFLFQPDPRLGSTVRTMRAALDDCRATRREVTDALALQQELRDVMRSGQAMFTAAVGAVKQRAEERRQLADRAKTTLEEKARARADKGAQVDQAREEQERLQGEVTRVTGHRDEATRRLQLLERARTHAERLLRDRAQRDLLQGELTTAEADLATAKTAAEIAVAELSSREDEHRRAADGMAQVVDGLKELAKQVQRFEWVTEQWNAAVERWGEPVESGSHKWLAEEVRKQRSHRVELVNNLSARLASAEDHAAAFAELLGLLRGVAERDVDPGEAAKVLSRQLARTSEAENQARRIPQIRAELAEAERAARAWDEAQALARRLFDDAGGPVSSSQVHAAGEQLAQRQEEAVENQRMLETRSAEHERLASESERVAAAAADQLKRWREARQVASALGSSLGMDVLRASDVDLADDAVAERREAVGREVEANDRARTAVVSERLALSSGQGEMDARILGARSALNGRLLAERFENVPVEDAARLEALLGPRAAGLLVTNVDRAARELDRLEDPPPEVWLFEGQSTEWSMDALPAGTFLDRGVAVEVEGGVRWTRIPESARLGKAARQRRIEAIDREIAALEEEQEGLLDRRRQLESANLLLRRLRPLCSELDEPDPGPRRDAALATATRQREQQAETAARAAEAEAVAVAADTRRKAFRPLIRVAHLLDRSDPSAVASDLRAALTDAEGARSWLERHSETLDRLRDGSLTLSRVPLSPSELAALERETRGANAELGRLLEVERHVDAVLADEVALEFGSARQELESQESIRDTLRRAEFRARELRDQAFQFRAAAEQREAAALKVCSTVSGRLDAANERVADGEAELADIGVGMPTVEEIDATRTEVGRCRTEVKNLQAYETDARDRVVRLSTQLEAASQAEEAARETYEGHRVPAERSMERWTKPLAR